MPYKLVIFDFDGTLADSFPYFLRTVNTLALTYKFPVIQPEDVDHLRGMDARQMMKRAKLPAWKMPLIARSFIRLMARDIDQIQLFEGIPVVLHQLAEQGVRLAIVSSNSEANIRRVLGPACASLISYYGCGASLFGKRRKFTKAMKRNGVLAHETICIGDELRDLEAARQVATAFGGVAWGYTRADVLASHPDVTLFHTSTDLLQKVLGVPQP
ncbi:HAD family hydrolase [Siphonobacter sp. BAB-5385]|uniref:HAD hydrolase-like protein n=1 Tax=Siphonobacter sp. BAB-5385 TaxID=1864822 RepID=UPI000B9E48A8|nr:HAD hydrolase-like protein [Siphonobacter sp. BAB-5385]OZI09717.1 HAD family hydrolase [Siphonobacter sp. BAB-5385]